MLRYLLASALVLTVVAGTAPAASDRGIVTEVTKDRITIQNDDGQTTTYKVAEDLVNNTRKKFRAGYPNKLSEVSQGCKIEVEYKKQAGDWVITDIEVKEEKPKEKDK
jgi:hypothetical protein